MRICRFQLRQGNEIPQYGILEGDVIFPTGGSLPFGSIDPDRANSISLSEAHLLAPCEPSKIVAIGRNYREHAAELGHDVPVEPLIFLKPPSAIIGPEDPIRRPTISQRVDFEGELVVVIGRTATRLSEDHNPLDFVLGYTCGIDVTARDLQKKDVQFTRAKGFDTFAPLGPVITTGLDPGQLDLETRVNGQVRQKANTKLLIFPVEHVLRFVTQVMTLLPGDVIFTGTPAGVGPLNAGDVIEVDIDGIGVLRNPVT